MRTYIGFALVLTVLSSCGTKKNQEQEQPQQAATVVELTDEQVKNAAIQTGKIEFRNISTLLKLNGKIEVPPQNMVSVSVPLGGYLRYTQLLPGMHIRKGETIARLEDPQYIQLQQDYLTTKARLAYTEKEYFRQRDLNQSKASSDKVFEAIQAEFLSQKVALSALGEKLKLIYVNPDRLTEATISRSISIPSPIDGFVSAVNQNIGKYITPTDVLFELVNPQDIHLQLTVFEKDLPLLAIGQKVSAYNNTDPSKKYECELILIGKDVSPERTVQVHCHFERYDKTLIPGMYMNAEVEVAPNKAYVIPNDGLVRFEGKEYVFIETRKNNYAMQEVSSQNNENGYTQVLFPDSVQVQDQRFVTQGAYALLMKMKNGGDE